MNRTQVLKFVNDCHSPSNGQFCSDGSLLTRVVDNVDLRDINKTHPERFGAMVRVMGIIDSIHGVPDGYPVASVEVWSEIGGGAKGAYNQGEHLIKLAEDSPEFAATTLCHEYGHFLSLQSGEGKMDFLNKIKKDPSLNSWYDAVKSTPQFQKLNEMQGNSDLPRSVQDHADYLLDSRELFARSYSQFIATKSGDKTLVDQHKKMYEQTDGLYSWTDKEFEPIGAALESWLRGKGWMR